MTSRSSLFNKSPSLEFDAQNLRQRTHTSRGIIVADSNGEMIIRENGGKDEKDKKDDKANNDQLSSKQKLKMLNKKFKKKFSDIQIKQALLNAGDVAGPILLAVGGVLGTIVVVPALLAGGAVVSVVVMAGAVVGGVLVTVLGPPVMGAVGIVAAHCRSNDSVSTRSLWSLRRLPSTTCGCRAKRSIVCRRQKRKRN